MNALRIFAHAPRRRVLVRPGRVMPEIVEPPPIEEAPLETIAAEPLILDILASAPQFGETIDVAYRRKEHALAELFASLTRDDAAVLHRRLLEPRADDAVGQRFARLVVERRTRLLAILADVPRRRAR